MQEQINLIAKEALANALLHSRGTCVEIELEYSARRLRVVVRDNGCGMDPRLARARRDSHWGLLGMRERAEKIGAQLTVWSRAGAGQKWKFLCRTKRYRMLAPNAQTLQKRQTGEQSADHGRKAEANADDHEEWKIDDHRN